MIEIIKNIKIINKYDIIFLIGDNKNLLSNIDEKIKYYTIETINDLDRIIKKENINKNLNIGIYGNYNITELNNYKYLLSFILFYKERLNELISNQNKINIKLKENVYNKNIENIIDDFIDLNKDGKYIRGTLIALGYFLSNKELDNDYLNLAYAYEMFQTSVLIHDDIIDNASIRRGKNTIPSRICKKYLNKINNKDYHDDVLNIANSLGICAGDLGFYEANKLIIKNYSNNPNLIKILELYNDIIIRTIKGEMLDVILPFKGKYNLSNPEEKDILDIYHLKTSWYTIIGPFFLGFILGGKDIDEKIKNILNKLGIAFQIKDDILGIFSNSKDIGKSNTSDIEEFKQTILYSHVISTKYKEEFLSIYGKKNITDKELEKVREILKISGSYDYAINYLNNLYIEVLNDIDNIKLLDIGKDILKGLLIYINIREK